jgi:hypothetical protein
MAKQRCPISSAAVDPNLRYPRYICQECAVKATSADGRLLAFSNVDMTGGFAARYVDTGEKYESRECFIGGVKCRADEARFGGIVIEVAGQLDERMAVFHQLLQLYAHSIFSKTNALARLELSPNQRKRLRASITADIRTCGLLIYPEVKLPEVSEAAQREAERIGIRICDMTWYNQTAFDKGRKVFHWEHVNPISCIQKSCEEAKSEEEIVDILMRQLRIAWILKREDAELTRLGYRSKREDGDSAYRDAKIVLPKIEA